MTPRLPRRALPVPYEVKVVLDSVAPCGERLTTFALTYPRFVHAELLTHRIFSRNSASSRAIPSDKMRKLVTDTPALPVFWGKNQSGMQAREELDDEAIDRVKTLWIEARNVMIHYSDALAKLGLHKQLCNRLTEVWMPITVLVSSTSFENWFHLRDHRDAQPEIQVIATEMHYQYLASVPALKCAGEWHLPYAQTEDFELPLDVVKKISVGRCARVSYLTHEGTRDPARDVELHDKLLSTIESPDPGHFSPFEHVAEALGRPEQVGNFVGWRQYRKDFANEAGPAGRV